MLFTTDVEMYVHAAQNRQMLIRERREDRLATLSRSGRGAGRIGSVARKLVARLAGAPDVPCCAAAVACC
jgi:hypothetical protein